MVRILKLLTRSLARNVRFHSIHFTIVEESIFIGKGRFSTLTLGKNRIFTFYLLF